MRSVSKIVCIIVLLSFFQRGQAQQYPWLTQYRGNLYMFNPAFCGSKRFFDFRMFYRNQWNGFQGAPSTYGASLGFRFANGSLGAGGFVFRDVIGPFQNTNSALTLAYHLKMSDVQMSFGFQANLLSQGFDGRKVTLHNSVDRSIDQFSSSRASTVDGSFGFLISNPTFHFGVAGINMFGSEMTHFTSDPFRHGKYKNQPAFSISAGYNFAENEDYTFENAIMVLYSTGIPFYFDYTLRFHIYQRFFVGTSIRLKDAIALHAGVTIAEQFQFAYSYDIVVSPLRKYQGGSHELKLVFSSNLGRDEKRKGINKRFLKQKFQYLLE